MFCQIKQFLSFIVIIVTTKFLITNYLYFFADYIGNKLAKSWEAQCEKAKGTEKDPNLFKAAWNVFEPIHEPTGTD